LSWTSEKRFCKTIDYGVRYAAFLGTEYNEVFLGYQPGQVMVFETLVFSLFNHLTRLTAQENFIIMDHGIRACQPGS
jgi:hypothetical protein